MNVSNFDAIWVVRDLDSLSKNYRAQVILKEAKEAIKKGFKEIWLLGQNVNDYYPIPFAELLRKVAAIPGDFQIRPFSPGTFSGYEY